MAKKNYQVYPVPLRIWTNLGYSQTILSLLMLIQNLSILYDIRPAEWVSGDQLYENSMTSHIYRYIAGLHGAIGSASDCRS